MTKLTIYLRERIVEEALKREFDPEKKILTKRNESFGDRIYETIVSKQRRDAIEALGPDWFRHASEVSCNFGGYSLTIPFSTARPVPPNVCSYGQKFAAFVVDDRITNEAREIASALEELKGRRDAAKSKLMGFLNSFPTFKALRAAWPEGNLYYDQFDKPGIKLPAPLTDDINKLFGLPKAPVELAEVEVYG